MLVSSTAVLSAPLIEGQTITTGQVVGIVYRSNFVGDGFDSFWSAANPQKAIAAAAKASAIMKDLEFRHAFNGEVVKLAEAGFGDYFADDAAIQWAKMRPLAVTPELTIDGTGVLFVCTFEAVENPVFPWIFVGLLVAAIAAVLIADDLSEAEVKIEGLEQIGTGFHKLADALGTPGTPMASFAEALKVAFVAALVIGGLRYLK
jgi:hypothetical protein